MRLASANHPDGVVAVRFGWDDQERKADLFEHSRDGSVARKRVIRCLPSSRTSSFAKYDGRSSRFCLNFFLLFVDLSQAELSAGAEATGRWPTKPEWMILSFTMRSRLR